VGTGIGGGIIVDGRVIRGARNLAGEIGHVTVARDFGLEPCTCGRYGCLESRASGPYLARRAAAIGLSMKGGRDPSKVFELVRAGNATARQLIAEVADDLAHAIGAAVCLVSPSVVIVGGGVSEQGEVLLRPLRRALPRYMLPQHAAGLKVVRARLGYDAGIMGAIALALARVE
jgi:glucokinase